MPNKNTVTHDMILYAELTNISPLVMGAQKTDETDLEILKHSDENPYISGTAVSGKLLRYFNETVFEKHIEKFTPYTAAVIQKNIEYLIGKERISQSHISIQNLELISNSDVEIKLNDSNKISKQTGEINNKFNFEKLESGCTFAFEAHLKLREGFDLDFFKDAILFIRAILNDNFTIGAKTTKGYGRLQCHCFKYKLFDYTQDNTFTEWETYLKSGTFVDEFETLTPTYFKYSPPQKVVFDLNLAIKSQFITGETVIDTHDVDKKQSQRKGSFILKGEAVKGAISHRAFRILNTVSNGNTDWVNALMLYVFGEDFSGEENHKPAHLRNQEGIFSNVHAEQQTRIKISRFTQGVVNGAMVESLPINSTTSTDEPDINLKFELTTDIENKHYSNAVTLMLMLIKDLFTEDLSIGGEKATGKGIVIGCKSQIQLSNETIEIDQTGFTGDYAHIFEAYNEFNLPKYENTIK